jgi:hypothetical protein
MVNSAHDTITFDTIQYNTPYVVIITDALHMSLYIWNVLFYLS